MSSDQSSGRDVRGHSAKVSQLDHGVIELRELEIRSAVAAIVLPEPELVRVVHERHVKNSSCTGDRLERIGVMRVEDVGRRSEQRVLEAPKVRTNRNPRVATPGRSTRST